MVHVMYDDLYMAIAWRKERNKKAKMKPLDDLEREEIEVKGSTLTTTVLQLPNSTWKSHSLILHYFLSFLVNILDNIPKPNSPSNWKELYNYLAISIELKVQWIEP